MKIKIGLILSAAIIVFHVILKTYGVENLDNLLLVNLQSWVLSLILLLTLISMLTEKVADFNFDKGAISILIFSGVLISMFNNIAHFIITIIITIKLASLTKKRWNELSQINWYWIVLSVGLTALVLVPATIIALYNSKVLSVASVKDVPNILTVVVTFMVQMNITAVWEEVFFRGLLWGYLLKMGLSIKQAGLLQFLLFWLFHYNGQSSNMGFYVSLPLEILVQTLLVYKSKQLTPSIISHALYNTFSPLLWRFFV